MAEDQVVRGEFETLAARVGDLEEQSDQTQQNTYAILAGQIQARRDLRALDRKVTEGFERVERHQEELFRYVKAMKDDTAVVKSLLTKLLENQRQQ